MKLLFLCGCFEKQHEAEVASITKGLTETASNLHQRRLMEGLRSKGTSLQVISAPFIGAWPVRSNRRVFRGFRCPSNDEITYVPFHNLWGWRSISRGKAMLKPVAQFIKNTQGAKRAVIVYAPHTPFLYAAVRAKRMAPDLHICLIVPDLPQYMNLNAHRRGFYQFCKAFDIRLFQKLNREVDSYLLLTRPMAEALQTQGRPYAVAEGITNGAEVRMPECRNRTFVYAGKLVACFGVERLLKAFCLLHQPEYRMIICGDGEMRPMVEQAARVDSRICYRGVLSHSELEAVFQSAGVLVNPRTGKETYTLYSFPSKIIEYLQTGLPVVSNALAGMPPIYQRLMYCPRDDSAASLAQTMERAMCIDAETESVRLREVQRYLQRLHPAAVGGRLLDMLAGEGVQGEC